MERIELSDSFQNVIVKLTEGNPGAMHVCLELFSKAVEIDPDSALGGIGPLLALDSHGIYGPSIWMLYKDVCGRSISKTIALLRAVHLGFLGVQALKHAIANRGQYIDVEALCAEVKERLPRFNLE